MCQISLHNQFQFSEMQTISLRLVQAISLRLVLHVTKSLKCEHINFFVNKYHIRLITPYNNAIKYSKRLLIKRG